MQDISRLRGSYNPLQSGSSVSSVGNGGNDNNNGDANNVSDTSQNTPAAKTVKDEYVSSFEGEADKLSEAEFTPAEERMIVEMRNRDRKVRAHEQAHVAVGGRYITSGPTYQYESGPDKRRYAVGGEVGIDASPISGSPEATIVKMQTVRAAALAPPETSAQDRAVAAAASRNEATARVDLRMKTIAEAEAIAEQGRGERGDVAVGENGGDSQNIAEGYRRQSKVFADAATAYSAAGASGSKPHKPFIGWAG